ncbi:MAG: DUF4238 domain-containing protein [Candidatus Andersenbacteria bacterium]
MGTARKRHHYLPQFYLRRFADADNMIWLFDRKDGEYRHVPISHAGLHKEYYSFKDEDTGRYNRDIENLLATIDGVGAPIIEKLVAGNTNLTQEEVENLTIYAAFQMTRVPEYEKGVHESAGKMQKMMTQMNLHSVERVQQIMNKMRVDENKEGYTAKEMFDYIQGGKYDIKFSRVLSLQYMTRFVVEVAPIFSKLDWVFAYSDTSKTPFITSDNPFFVMPPKEPNINNRFRGTGILVPGCEKVLSLAPNLCLIMGDPGTRRMSYQMPRQMVKDLNTRIAAYSDRFVLSKDLLLVKRCVKRSKVDQWRKEQRVQLFAPGIGEVI